MLIVLKSALLGIVQGLTEFIPVSSSGHLILVSRMFGWHDSWVPGTTTSGAINTAALAFTVALHIGTLVALLFYFNREWIVLIKSFFTGFAKKPGRWDTNQRLAWFLVLATIPAGVVGALWGDTIEGNLSTPFWIAICLIGVSFVMLAAQMLGSKSRGIELIKGRDAASAGFAQIIALAPGVSRSGITMSGGLFSGLDFEAAARFAFLLAAPIMAGTGILEGVKLVKHGLPPHFAQIFIPGFVLAAVVGLLAIKFMLGYLKRGTLMPFIIYRFALAAVVLIVLGFTRL